MNLIIAHTHDQSAQWLHQQALGNGLDVERITPEQMVLARHWTQSLQTHEDGFEVVMTDGRRLTNDGLGRVINRVQNLSLPHWKFAAKKEADYAAEEMSAAFLSLLYAMARHSQMYNPPAANGFAGAYFHASQWRQIAAGLGIPVADFEQGGQAGGHGPAIVPVGASRVLVVGGRVVTAEKSSQLTEDSIRISQATGMPLLELFYQKSGTSYQFLHGNTFPDFRAYKSSIVQLLFHQPD